MQQMQGEEDCTWRGGGGCWWCCGGGRWRCRGSRTAAPGGSVAVPSGSTTFSRFLVLFSFLSSLPVSSFPSSQCWVFGGSLWFGFPSVFGLFPLFPLPRSFSLFSFSLRVPSSLFFSSPFAAVLGVIYRASECGFLLWRMGSRSRGGWAVGAAVQACLPRFRQRGGWSASRCGCPGVASVSAFQGRGASEIGRAHV